MVFRLIGPVLGFALAFLTLKYPEDLTQLIKRLRRLARNPVYMFRMFHSVVAYIAIGGYALSFPRYAQHQFAQSASDASLLAAFIPYPLMYGSPDGRLLHRLGGPMRRTRRLLDIHPLPKMRYLINGFTTFLLCLGTFFQCIMTYYCKRIQELLR
ncbi:hypothetical protein MRX96_053721 [Rhipicephalus microplus]